MGVDERAGVRLVEELLVAQLRAADLLQGQSVVGINVKGPIGPVAYGEEGVGQKSFGVVAREAREDDGAPGRRVSPGEVCGLAGSSPVVSDAEDRALVTCVMIDDLHDAVADALRLVVLVRVGDFRSVGLGRASIAE